MPKTVPGKAKPAKSRATTATKAPRSILIKGGEIFTAADSCVADILIEGETITQIGTRLEARPGTEVIDAGGLEIYPGGIDAHTHFELPFMGTVSADDFASGTTAAACGGTTTILDFIIPAKGQSLLTAIDAWHKKADGKAVVDYGFHLALTEFNDRVAAEIPKVVARGITSFKCFMAYKGALMIDDDQLLEVLQKANQHGVLVSVHAENGDILAHIMRHLTAEGLKAPRYHPVAHPAIAEEEATHRAITLAAMCGSPLYIVHLSSGLALQEVKKAREMGLPVFAETCPQYLLLSADLYEKKGFEGAKWVMSPPLRESYDQEDLWEGLRDGYIQTVATDHCSFRFKGQKDMGKSDFLKIPNGIPAVHDRVNLLYTYGVLAKRITRHQFASLIATAPARLFGLAPKKGTVAVGADADLLLMDPHKKWTITAANSRHNVDYSAFEGMELSGMPAWVLSRGEVVARDNKYVGKTGRGRYLSRQRFSARDLGFEME